MKGVYRFYQDGVLLAEQENILTTEGKKLILRFLAGQAANLGEGLVVGVGAATPVVGDYRMNFEIDRTFVSLKNADYTNQYIVFKGTLPQIAEYKIYEVGLFSTHANSVAGEYSGKVLTTFDTSVETWTNSSVDTSAPRTSVNSLLVSATGGTTTSTRTSVDLNLAGYSPNDEFTIAFTKNSANITSLALAFENATGGSFKRTLSIAALPNGYNILSFRKGDFTATGTIDWAALTQFGVDVISATTTGNVVLDGIRVEDTDTINPNYVLVSRALLASPLTKSPTAPLDIEYALDLSFA